MKKFPQLGKAYLIRNGTIPVISIKSFETSFSTIKELG
jgi:hypothetical protein